MENFIFSVIHAAILTAFMVVVMLALTSVFGGTMMTGKEVWFFALGAFAASGGRRQ